MRSLNRRGIALLAAYVLALQAVLPFVALSVAFAVPICASATSDAGHSGDDSTGCPCAAGCGMLCGSQAGALPPVAAAVVPARGPSVISHAAELSAPHVMASRHQRPAPRGPPIS